MIVAPGAEPVAARGLVKGFGALRVLAGVDLDVPRGSCVAIVGPNGAGKTTLLRILAGISRPAAGSVRLFGHECSRNGTPAPIRARVGLVAHEPLVYRDLPVRANLEVFASLYPGSEGAATRAGRALERFGLEQVAERPARALSRGFLQRLALARATLHEPELLLLDEPLTGLDASARERTLDELVAHRARAAQILVSHDAADIAALATSVHGFRRGRLARLSDRPVAESDARRLMRDLGAIS